MSIVIATCQRLALAWMIIQMLGCNQAAKQSGGSAPKAPTVTTSSSQQLSSVAFSSLTPSNIWTAAAKSNNCSAFTVTALDDKKSGLANVAINLSLVGVSDDQLATWGKLSTPITTGASGTAIGTFCAADQVGQVVIVANATDPVNSKLVVKANSGPVKITLKPVYTLNFTRTDLPRAGSLATDAVKIDLFESGPNDCGKLYFQLKKLEDPVVGVQLKFRSDYGYPAGVKLSAKSAAQFAETDPVTNKKFLSFTASTDEGGLVAVPICAGSLPGSLFVFTDYTDEFGNIIHAQTPTIVIGAGFANFLNLDLRFDPTNARTLRTLFNNEMPSTLNFSAKINSKMSGGLSVFDPISVILESGELSMSSGVPDAAGKVDFSVSASHNSAYRPTPVLKFISSQAQSYCDASAIAKERSLTNFNDVAKNWRTTMAYSTRGQEAYNDSNRNQKYDVGGDGFWDKNQDGVYTRGTDAVTYFGVVAAGAGCRCITSRPGALPITSASAAPTVGFQSPPCIEDPTKASCFRNSGEWFIDLPTPFVDADENGIYEEQVNGESMDRVIGDTYQDPNGKWDNDTLIWKSTVLPIYTGTSIYAMVRSSIAQDPVSLGVTSSPSAAETLDAVNYFSSYGITANHADLNRTVSDSTNRTVSDWHYMHAHGVCGTPAPGGTDLSVTTDVWDQFAGDRQLTAHFYIQPGDDLLDPSRRLLADGSGGSTAKLNFNIPEHGSAVAGYPVLYELLVSKCSRTPSGGIGNWCSPATFRIHANMDGTFVESYLTVNETDVSTCQSPTWRKNRTTYNCEACPASTPLTNTTNNTCGACPGSTPHYLSDSNTCEACDASTPRFDKSANTCNACTSDAPKYDSATNTCLACPSGKTWDGTACI